MIVLAISALTQVAGAVEMLPVDAVMSQFEEAIPNLKEIEAATEAEIGKLGAVESGWATSGLTAAAAISAVKGNASTDVLGEWVEGGHGVLSPSDRPLSVPQELHRYTVREYGGPVNYHTYHRLFGVTGVVVIHTYGTSYKVGNAECRRGEGIEVISDSPWQQWSPQTALTAFGLARATRDDSRVYCISFRAAGDGKFSEVAHTPKGQAYVAVNGDSQTFTLTSREAASVRIFGKGGSSAAPK